MEENDRIDMAWPMKGDRLMREEHSWQKSAEFDSWLKARDWFIWDGYIEAANILVGHCQTPRDRRTLIYPILFCYRHGIESAMKSIIRDIDKDSTTSEEMLKTHNLWKLWLRCKAIILDYDSTSPEEDLEAVEQVIKDFHDIDQSALSFRYATNKNGELNDLPNLSFSLENIQDVMNGVNGFFDAAHSWLLDLKSNVPTDCY